MMAPLTLVAAGVALLPGFHAWWTGRSLIARTADPAFPELLLARAQQRSMVAVGAGALVVPLAVEHWIWTVLLIAIAQLAGGFSFRKSLYAETWSLGEFLRFSIFSIIGAAGFWLLLGFAPRLVVAIVTAWQPERAVVAAAAIAAVFAILLLLWERHFPKVWLALHRGSPLERPDLQERLDDIVRRSGVTPAPAVYRFGAPGSYLMNAVALPSTTRPGVGFGDTLLEVFDTDEILAVFAHEIAHLEHYNARRLRRLGLITYGLILGGLATAVAAIAYLPVYASIIAMCWPMVVLMMLVQRISQSQKHERESDRRSAELLGDPEPMVRALTKLHHYSKLPRRWPYDFERSSSHPSLAHRIQALRASAQKGEVTSTGVEPAILRSTKAGSYIVLDAARIYWLDGVTLPPSPAAEAITDGSLPTEAAPLSLAFLRERATSYRATSYAELVELRVAVSAFGRAIQVRDRTGKTSATPLHPDDVAAAQRALDLLDGQLATRATHDWRRTTRMIAALLALLLVASLDFGWMWIPVLVALLAPSAWSLGASGFLIAGRAVVAAVAGTGRIGMMSWIVAALALVIGGAACVAAWRWARTAEPARRRRMIQLAAAMSGAVFLVAMQGYGARGARVEWTSAPADVMARFETKGFGRGVQLSPAGRRVAIQTLHQTHRDPYDDTDASSWRFTISDVGDSSGAPVRAIDAMTMAFLDEDRVLALRMIDSTADSLELVVTSAVRDSAHGWRRTLPPVAAPLLNVDRPTGRWTIVGHDVETSEMVVVRGALDDTQISVERNSYELLGGRPLHAWPDGTVISATVEVTFGGGRAVLAGMGLVPFEWTISRTRGGKREPIGTVPGVPDCMAHGGTTLHCVVLGTKGATLWRIDDDGTLTLLGRLPQEFDLWRIGGENRVIAADRGGGTIAIVDAQSERGTRLRLPETADGYRSFMMDAATAPGIVAALTTEDGHSEITVYRVR